jgi:fatty-acyl-CoA synthase
MRGHSPPIWQPFPRLAILKTPGPCVLRVEGSDLDEGQVIAFLKARLAAYKVPRKVLFIGQDDLDFTDTAKIKPAEARAFAGRKLVAEV